MNEVKNILNDLESIALIETGKINLMNRIDEKFIFSILDLPVILRSLINDFKVLEKEKERIFLYENIYYDTVDLKMYLDHHNGKLNRYKVRQRIYVNSNDVFLEMKFKNNKDRTIKERIEIGKKEEMWNETSKQFISSKTPYNLKELIPTLKVNYNRITLISKQGGEKITFDTDIQFIGNNITKNCKNLVIAEVKQVSKNDSVFFDIMKSRSVREQSISKYCIGIALTNTDIKKNNFKEKLLSLAQIEHDKYDIITSNG